jgi:hypothetical protein
LNTNDNEGVKSDIENEDKYIETGDKDFEVINPLFLQDV